MLIASFFNASNAWFNYLSAFFFTMAAFWTILRSVHHFWVGKVADDIDQLRKETQPNGGGSMRDSLDRIEQNQTAMLEYIMRVDKALEHHLGFHDGINEHAR